MSEAISHGRGPFARMNWDSPSAVNSLTATAPARRFDSGLVVVFACGCASWQTFPHGAVPDVPRKWVGARLQAFRWVDGRMVSDGRPLPSWTTCTHGGQA